MSVTINGTNGLTFNDNSTQTTAATGFGFKNRIINPAMVIDQRNAGASVSTNGSFPVDRFKIAKDTAGATIAASRSTTAPNNFINSLLYSVTTGASPAAGEDNYVAQLIEGLNVADFGFGTSAAQTITLSFKVRSSVTGTFGIGFANSAVNRTYVTSYIISAANTWEDKTVTIPGDTSGTWLTTNGIGLYVVWDLGCGTSRSQAAGTTWNANGVFGLTGGVKLVGTTGANIYITGVQLEKGSTATSFDYRPYGQELALCQRYFEKSYNVDVAPGTATFVGVTMFQVSSSTQTLYNSQKPFAVQKRATPTMTYYNPDSGASGSIRDVSAGANLTANGNANVGMTSTGAVTTSTSTTANNQLAAHYTAAIEL